MAIRFRCGSCSQPIEVDDEWATKVVACPYCRKTITAPAETTLGPLNAVPTASPIPGAATAEYGKSSKEPIQHPANPIAVVALVLVCVSFVSTMGGGVIISQHHTELEPLTEAVYSGFSEMAQAQADFYESHGGRPPGWFLTAALLQIIGGLLWIAGVVCGVIAVCFVHRRNMAITALVMAGILPVCVCCGGMVGVSG